MYIQKVNNQMDGWVEDAYLLACQKVNVPSFSAVLEQVYEFVHESMLYENIDLAILRGDHELYGMCKRDFFNWICRGDHTGEQYEPTVPIEEISHYVENYISKYHLFIEMYGTSYLNAPLQEVW